MFPRNLCAHTSVTRSKCCLGGRAYAPIHTLPAEILGYIFLLAIASNDRQPFKRAWKVVDVNMLTRLGVLNLVCAMWRDISLDYKVLWSTVPIHLSRHCRALPLGLFATILKRGGNAGLGVDIVVGMKRGRELGAYLSILHSHTRRIVEFKIKIESSADIRYVFPLEYPMPNLVRFCAVIAMTNRAGRGPPNPLNHYLPLISQPDTEGNGVTQCSFPTSLDSLHLELDTVTLMSLPQHVTGIRQLCLGATDTGLYGRNCNRSSPPVSIHGTYSLRLLATVILDCNLHFPDVTELVIDSQKASSALTNLEGVFPVVRSLSLGPLNHHDPCFIHTSVELIKQTRETVTELRFRGEYGVATIIERAYAAIVGRGGHDRSGVRASVALRRVVVEKMNEEDYKRKGIPLYTQTREDVREGLHYLLSYFQDLAITWNHRLRREAPHSAFVSDMEAMCLQFPGRLAWICEGYP